MNTHRILNPGMRFGKIVVMRRVKHPKKWGFFECRCDCGHTITVPGYRIGRVTTSCGCAKFKHGLIHSAEYRAWTRMKQRCYDINLAAWPRYGGRGIKVCEEWRGDFAQFYKDVGQRPSPHHSLDRWPDNDGDYKPGNVRWATRVEQGNNQRTNRRLSFRGRTQTIAAWSRDVGITASALANRIDRFGWPLEKALTSPSSGRGPKPKRENKTL